MAKKTTAGLLALAVLMFAPGFLQAGPVGAALGVRAGVSQNPDQLVLGVQAELGKLGLATIAPSVDVGAGDGTTVAAGNFDLRWYLFPLPQTGIDFYAAAGPTLAFFEGGRQELGLSLTAGAKIPMKGTGRYNVEARFGIGDIPDLKVMLGVLFGL